MYTTPMGARRALEFFIATVDAEIAGESDAALAPPDDMMNRANIGLLYHTPRHGVLRVTCGYGIYHIYRAQDEQGNAYVVTHRVQRDVSNTVTIPPLVA